MPDLPTLTVTAAQATRIQNAYGSVEQYRTWLRQAIRNYVKAMERETLQEQYVADLDASAAAVDSDLTGI